MNVGLGKMVGQTLLVLSGVTREEELQQILKDTSSDIQILSPAAWQTFRHYY